MQCRKSGRNALTVSVKCRKCGILTTKVANLVERQGGRRKSVGDAFAQHLADAVLECFAVSIAHDALIDNGKAEGAAVGRRTIARQTRDACQRARLGAYVTHRCGLLHAVFQRAVDTRNG